MYQSRLWQWSLPLFAMLLLSACRNSREHTYPDDPLFVKRAPIEAKARKMAMKIDRPDEPLPPDVPRPIFVATRDERARRFQPKDVNIVRASHFEVVNNR